MSDTHYTEDDDFGAYWHALYPDEDSFRKKVRRAWTVLVSDLGAWEDRAVPFDAEVDDLYDW